MVFINTELLHWTKIMFKYKFKGSYFTQKEASITFIGQKGDKSVQNFNHLWLGLECQVSLAQHLENKAENTSWQGDRMND